jgi:hypothetical protein
MNAACTAVGDTLINRGENDRVVFGRSDLCDVKLFQQQSTILRIQFLNRRTNFIYGTHRVRSKGCAVRRKAVFPRFPLDPSGSSDNLIFSVRACGGNFNRFPTFFFPTAGEELKERKLL